MSSETPSKVESCRRNPMHFAEGAGELAPLEQPWTETASEEHVSGSTVLLLRIVAEKRPPDVEKSY